MYDTCVGTRKFIGIKRLLLFLLKPRQFQQGYQNKKAHFCAYVDFLFDNQVVEDLSKAMESTFFFVIKNEKRDARKF